MKKLHSIFLEPNRTNGTLPLVHLYLSGFCYLLGDGFIHLKNWQILKKTGPIF